MNNIIITGGPGTGKSTVAKHYLEVNLLTTEMIDGHALLDIYYEGKDFSFSEDKICRCKVCKVLIIDNFSSVLGLNLHLEEIIDILEYRYKHHRAIVLIVHHICQLQLINNIFIIQEILKHSYKFQVYKFDLKKNLSKLKSILNASTLEKINEDYSHICEIIFYPVTLSKDYESKKHKELAIILDKNEFYPLYKENIDLLEMSRYWVDEETQKVHFPININKQGLEIFRRYSLQDLILFNPINSIKKKLSDQAESWTKKFSNEFTVEFVIEYIGFVEDYTLEQFAK